MFLNFLLFKDLDDGKVSLTSFVTALRSRFKKTFRKQSLHDRFTPQAVRFTKQLVKEQLSKQITTSLKGSTHHFQRIKIKDSTRFQIPEHLKDAYPGSGGGASEAGVHIQLEYELLSGEVTDLNLTDAKRQDTTDAAETTGSIEKGDLIIRDLGYFVQWVFNQIIEAGAYFLSRVKPKTVLYDKDGEKIDLIALHKHMKKHQIVRLEKQVTSNEIKHPVRLIIERLPEEVVEKRVEKARKEAKKKGRQLTDHYKAYAAFNLFITNVDKEKLSIDSAIKLYHIRWQIELRFKAWKSFCQLNKVKKMKKERFECQLYAKLLFILIIWELGYHFQLICYQTTGCLISLHKFYKMITEQATEFRQNLLKAGNQLKGYLIESYQISKESLLQEGKKRKLNLADLFTLLVDIQLVND